MAVSVFQIMIDFLHYPRTRTACVCLVVSLACVLHRAAAEEVLVPRITGDWTTIANSPDLGELTTAKQQPVDFAIWQAADGRWQLWSCIRYTKESGKSRLFYRWESGDLASADWTPAGIAMTADTALGETDGGLQAPYVFRDENGRQRMFYGDWVRICSAESADGKTFQRDANAGGQPALFDDGPEANTRDPFVIRIGDKWYCYYTAIKSVKVTEKGKPASKKTGAVYCRTSSDLKNWSAPKVVASDGGAGDGPYSAECPHVVEVSPGHYYLFRTQHYGKDAQTRVYHSTDPMNFGFGALNYVDALHFVTSLPIAAPEIIRQGDQWFIAALRNDLRGVQIARLKWDSIERVQPALPPPPLGTAIRVALYDDNGSAGKGVPNTVEQLGACKDIELSRLKADAIRGGLDGYDVVIFTGGTGGRQANTIGLLGREQVHRFVERGGGYVGVCAGAYLACDGFSWSVHVLDAKTPSPKWERGRAQLELAANPAGSALLGLPKNPALIVYHNGPLMVPAQNPAIPDFEVLATFRTEVAGYGSPPGIMVNTPAMVLGRCGKGRVIVSSPHPEQTTGMEKWMEHAVRAVARTAAMP